MPVTEQISQTDRQAIEAGGAFSVIDEDYGFSVRPGPALRRRATLVEWTAQYMGFLIVFVTIGAVASSSGLSGAGLDIFEAGIAAVGAALAGFFFWIGTRGTAVELQVDGHHRELRTAIRNWRGSQRVLETQPFHAIDSAFVHRRSARARNAKFCIRTVAEPDGIELIGGAAAGLAHLHEVMVRTMRRQPLIQSKARKMRPVLAQDNPVRAFG